MVYLCVKWVTFSERTFVDQVASLINWRGVILRRTTKPYLFNLIYYLFHFIN
jgi:hypothetical protein